MITRCRFYCVILVSFVGLAGNASGQQEQWLRYRCETEPYDFIGRTWKQDTNATSKPPAGVKLPELGDDAPFFVEWETTMAKKPVWVALVRSKKKGKYDTLYIDSNLDGSLADEKSIKASSADVYDKGKRYAGEFQLVKLLFPGKDGPITYHLNVDYSFDKRYSKDVSFSSAGWYEGSVTIGGKKYWCTLVDRNDNGRFGESCEPNWGDRIWIAPKINGKFTTDDNKVMKVRVGRLVEVDGKFYSLQIAPDGAYVIFDSPEKIETGKIQLGKDVNEFSVFGKEGNFYRIAKDGLAENIPVGKYNLLGYVIRRKDKSGAHWEIRETHAYNEKSFVVEPGKTVTLKVEEPFVCVVSVTGNGEKKHHINMNIESAKEDRVDVARNGSRPDAPKVRITSADCSYDKTFSLEYG